MKNSQLLGLFAALSLAGCAGQSATSRAPGGEVFMAWSRRELIPYTREIDAPPEKVLAAMASTFEQLGYPGGYATSGEKMFASRQLQVKGRLYTNERNSKYFDCGQTPAGNPAADEYSITFAILARVIPNAKGGAHAEAVIDGRANSRAQSSTFVNCRGTGLIENAALQLLEERIRSQ